MTKPKLGTISLLLIGGAAVPWLIQRHSDIKTIDALHTQLDQLNQQRTEDERLSSRAAESNAPSIKEGSQELLRLRGEVGVLRGQTNELRKLLAENRQTRSDLASGKHENEPSLTAGDLVPVGSLAFAGYGTPEATFQSIMSSFVRGDMTFLDGFTPERRQEEEKNRAGKSQAALAGLSAHFDGANVRILDSRLSSEDEAELVVYIVTEGEKRKENELTTLTMKRIAGEWKVSNQHDH